MWRADFLAVGANRHRVLNLYFKKVMDKMEEILIIHVLHAVVVLIRKQIDAIADERHVYEVRGLHWMG